MIADTGSRRWWCVVILTTARWRSKHRGGPGVRIGGARGCAMASTEERARATERTDVGWDIALAPRWRREISKWEREREREQQDQLERSQWEKCGGRWPVFVYLFAVRGAGGASAAILFCRLKRSWSMMDQSTWRFWNVGPGPGRHVAMLREVSTHISIYWFHCWVVVVSMPLHGTLAQGFFRIIHGGWTRPLLSWTTTG